MRQHKKFQTEGRNLQNERTQLRLESLYCRGAKKMKVTFWPVKGNSEWKKMYETEIKINEIGGDKDRSQQYQEKNEIPFHLR